MGIGQQCAFVIIGTGMLYLTAASHMSGAPDRIEAIHSTLVVETIAPASMESAHTAAGPSSARASSPEVSGARFRFGFLEFEDDPDASAE